MFTLPTHLSSNEDIQPGPANSLGKKKFISSPYTKDQTKLIPDGFEKQTKQNTTQPNRKTLKKTTTGK